MKARIRRSLQFIISMLPQGGPDFIYDTFLRWPPLKRIANSFLLSVFHIPETLRIEEGILALNQKDLFVSGAISIGAYEQFEIDLFRKHIRDGMTFLDIGAHIGYYSLIAATRSGKSGKVYAFEPNPDNLSYLKKTVAINNLKNVEYFDLAISNVVGDSKLFLSEDNTGDNRIFRDSHARNTLPIQTTSVDEFMKNRNRTVDIIKMDIQGAEMLALEGMRKTIQVSPSLILFTEFWSYGIKQSGHSPLSFLETLREIGFTILRINEKKKRLDEVIDFNMLVKNLSSKMYATLLCKKTFPRQNIIHSDNTRSINPAKPALKSGGSHIDTYGR